MSIIQIALTVLAYLIGCWVGVLIYRRCFMRGKKWKHKTETVTHINYLGCTIKLDYPLTFVTTY